MPRRQQNPAASNPHSELRQSQVEEAIAFWEPLAGRSVGREEAREIIDNMTTYFKILIEWDAADRRAAAAAEGNRNDHLEEAA